MRGELFLLAVVCASFVQVRGDYDLENPFVRNFHTIIKGNHLVNEFKTGIQPSILEVSKRSNQNLEDAISNGLLVTDSIHRLTVRLAQREWTNYDDIKQTVAKNLTEYTNRAKADEERMRKALDKAANNVRDEARNSDPSKLVLQCVDREERKANEEVKSHLKTSVNQITHLNFQFNANFTELHFPLLEKQLKDNHYEAHHFIKRCTNTTCVENVVQDYIHGTTHFCQEFSELVRRTFTEFIKHQQEVCTLYRTTTREIEKDYLVGVEKLRQCLYIRTTVLGKLIAFSTL